MTVRRGPGRVSVRGAARSARRRLPINPGRAAFYALALAFLALGVVMGSLSVNLMTPKASAEMIDVLEGAVHAWQVPGYAPDARDIFNQSVALNAKAAVALWAGGLTALALPVVVLVLFVRGFSLGFTAGALIYRHGVGGMGLTLAALLPGNLFLLPAFCLLGGQAFYFALGRLTDREHGPAPPRGGQGTRLLSHVALGGLAGLILLAGTLVEGYFVPVFLRWVVPLLG